LLEIRLAPRRAADSVAANRSEANAMGWTFVSSSLVGARAVLALALVAAVVLAPAANALQRRDVRVLDGVYKRSLDLTQSLTEAASGGVSQVNAGGDAQALDCLETLREAANQVSDQLMDVRDVARLAASLHRGPDRKLGAAAARHAAAGALQVLPVEGRQMSATASLCPSQATVQQKAHEGLALISDATVALKGVR
jgi:hypothetical protein